MNEDRNESSNNPTDQWWAFVMSELKAHEVQQRRLFGDIDENLIVAYASDTCTEIERARVELAMEKYPAVGETVAVVRKLLQV